MVLLLGWLLQHLHQHRAALLLKRLTALWLSAAAAAVAGVLLARMAGRVQEHKQEQERARPPASCCCAGRCCGCWGWHAAAAQHCLQALLLPAWLLLQMLHQAAG